MLFQFDPKFRGEDIPLISARRATRREVKDYES